MNKTTLIVLIALVAVGIGFYFVPKNFGETAPETLAPAQEEKRAGFDGKNTTFAIDGTRITLISGVSETPAAPNSASNVVTRYFGNEAYGDLNGDGLSDTAFLVTQERGGSGTFFYVVVALGAEDEYRMTNAFLVGDRIAPQTTEIHADSMELRVNFAKRKPGEPMTARPSMGVTLFLKVTAEGVLEGLMK